MAKKSSKRKWVSKGSDRWERRTIVNIQIQTHGKGGIKLDFSS